MQREKEIAVASIRNLIAYYTSGFQEGGGYIGKQQLIYLPRPQAEIALRYGVPIGLRDIHCKVMGASPRKPFRYVTITDAQMLERWLSFESMESLPTIHADLPRQVQKILHEYILQIMEIECPEHLPLRKPAAPVLGTRGDVFHLLCIVDRTLRQAGQLEQTEELWQRVLDSGDSYRALKIMREYVEFDEAYPSTAVLEKDCLWGDLRV